jgi:trehalose-6-phosphate synthase
MKVIIVGHRVPIAATTTSNFGASSYTILNENLALDSYAIASLLNDHHQQTTAYVGLIDGESSGQPTKLKLDRATSLYPVEIDAQTLEMHGKYVSEELRPILFYQLYDRPLKLSYDQEEKWNGFCQVQQLFADVIFNIYEPGDLSIYLNELLPYSNGSSLDSRLSLDVTPKDFEIKAA